MKRISIVTTALSLLLTAGAARAADVPAAAEARKDIEKTLGFVPKFFDDVPQLALSGIWDELKGLQLNPNTALSGKVKELTGLAVASQIPCKYCIDAHTEFAMLNGASRAEVGEAVMMAALTRHWSTYLNGIQTDEARFRGEIAKIVENVKKAAASGKPAPKPLMVTDGQSALRDMAQTLGDVPEFLKRFPESGRAGAWKQFRDIQLNPATALSAKNKELMGLAVASQVPCKFCIIAHTEFAKLAGAGDAEINEAIGMAALTRDLSTLLNGLSVDKARWDADVKRIVSNVKAAQQAPQRTAKAR